MARNSASATARHNQSPLRRRGKNLLQKYTKGKFLKQSGGLFAKAKPNVCEQDQRDEDIIQEKEQHCVNERQHETLNEEKNNGGVNALRNAYNAADESTAEALREETPTLPEKQRSRHRSLSSKYSMNSSFWKAPDSLHSVEPSQGTETGHVTPHSFKSFISRKTSSKADHTATNLAEITEEVPDMAKEVNGVLDERKAGAPPTQKEDLEPVTAKDDTSHTTNTSISSTAMQSLNNEDEQVEQFVFGLEQDGTGSLTEEKLSIIENDDGTEVTTTSRKTAKSKRPESQKSDDSVCASKQEEKDMGASRPEGSVSSRKSKAASVRKSDQPSIASRGNASHKSRASIASSRKAAKSITKGPAVNMEERSIQNNDGASTRSKKSQKSSSSKSVQSKTIEKEMEVSVHGSKEAKSEKSLQPVSLPVNREAQRSTEEKVSNSQTTRSVHNTNLKEPKPMEAINLDKIPSAIQHDDAAISLAPSQITWTSADSQAETDVVSFDANGAARNQSAVMDANINETPHIEEKNEVNLDNANSDTLLVHEALTAVATELTVRKQSFERDSEKWARIIKSFCCFFSP